MKSTRENPRGGDLVEAGSPSASVLAAADGPPGVSPRVLGAYGSHKGVCPTRRRHSTDRSELSRWLSLPDGQIRVSWEAFNRCAVTMSEDLIIQKMIELGKTYNLNLNQFIRIDNVKN